MKKFNRMIAGTCVVYLCMSLLLLLYLYQQKDNKSRAYLVEANRLMAQIETLADVTDMDLSNMQSIEKVRFLSAEELRDETKITAFFNKENGMDTYIEPLFLDGKLSGYVSFSYLTQLPETGEVPAVAMFLAALFALLLLLLFYLRNQVVKPFLRLSEMPYELSKGHLKGELWESKNRFFGKFTWGIAMLRDTLNDAKMRELKLEREKKLLLLSISHDIKTPLCTIQLYAKALDENVYDTEEKRRGAAKHILSHTREIENYVKKIVKSSSEDILSVEVKQSEFYLADFVKMIAANYKPKCKLLQIKFFIGTYENKLLRGDIDRAFEVVENLMENAFKYGDGKEIAISIYEEEYCQLIRIKNTGPLVSEQEQMHLFDSFYRGSNASEKPGNGLGLYICRQIMHKMDGEIFAEREDDGMSFVLVFHE